MANIFHVERAANKITLGTTGTTINIASHTASRLLALDASKDLEVVTIGSSLDYTRPTLNTIQDIRTSASPTFVGLTLSSIAVEDTDVDKFLVDSSGVIKYRTGAQVLSDIGGIGATLTQEQVEDYAGTLVANATGTHTGISITYQDATGDIDFIVDHDAASNFVANEHIDHTNITLTAGTGLTGGGDISANRTFAVDGLLEDLDTLGANAANSEFLVGTGAGVLVWESGATARTSIGLGTGNGPTFTEVILTNTTPIEFTGGTRKWLTHVVGNLLIFAPRNDGDTNWDWIRQLKLDGATGNVIFPNSLYLKEQASADADTGAYGQIWVKTATPNELWFTNDIGTGIPISTPFSAYTNEDSEGNAMLRTQAYKAATDGYVAAKTTITVAGNMLYGYVGLTNDPYTDGDLVGCQEADANGSTKSIFFAVAKDEYFEIRTVSSTPTILWKSKGVLSKPVDQD